MAEPAPTDTPTRSPWPFLGMYFAIYVIVATGINLWLGPPGMSGAFLEDHKAGYDHYIETIKDTTYHKWTQRPELNPPGAALQARIDFVREFETIPAFKQENRRRGWYGLIFDFFNVFMVVWLVAHFARGPLAGMLDGMVEKVRTQLSVSEKARARAMTRSAAAAQHLAGLAKEKEALETETEQRIEEMRRESALATGRSLQALNRETEDRKRNEEVRAVHAMKTALVENALQSIVDDIHREGVAHEDAALIRDFVTRLEKQA